MIAAPLWNTLQSLSTFQSKLDETLQEEDERTRFERIILFLASVPLFKQQLPKSELPKVAQLLRETVWAPGKTLVKQGEIGRTFFLIYSGCAAVLTSDEQGLAQETATLSAGDWLGSHALHSERPNVATIVAKGPEPLVTLSMSKRDFEASGLVGKLRLPKRAALRKDTNMQVAQIDVALGSMSPLMEGESEGGPKGISVGHVRHASEELNFILSAIRRNAHLRAFQDIGDAGHARPSEGMLAVAASADRREVKKGDILARRGDLGQEFFIIREGTVELVADEEDCKQQRKSAEAAVAGFSMAERIRRKQHFMLQLYKPIATPAMGKRGISMLIHDPRIDNGHARGHGHSQAHLQLHGSGRDSGPGRPLLRKADSGFNLPSLESPMHSSGSSPAVAPAVFGGGSPMSCSDGGTPQQSELLHAGDSFGELSLLYNIRREATFRACEDAVVYAICRRQFKKLMSRDNGRRRFREYCSLVDEVEVLACLLRSERRELACNVTDFVTFPPGHRVLHQGRVREMLQWYIIHSGSAVMSQDVPAPGGGTVHKVLGDIVRPGHFGERSLLKPDKDGRCIAEINVDAGPGGLTCLVFDGEMIRGLLGGLRRVDDSVLPGVGGDISEFCRSKQLRSRNGQCAVQLSALRAVSVLGKGAFGAVFLTRDSVDGQLYALKRLSKGHAQRAGTLEQLCWERDLLSMLDSPFVVHLYKTFKDDQFVYLLMEVALGGDLYGMLCHHHEVFKEDNPRGFATAFYTGCIIAGIEHLHERRIIYRDMKPENIMLDIKGYGKVCDMGLARFVCGKTNTQVGTPDYMAPEMIDPPHYYDASVDWWSLGVLAYELLCRQTPYDAEGLEDLEESILAIRRSQERGPLTFPFGVPPLAQDFVMKLLQKVPRRLGFDGGAAAIRQHILFTRMNFDFNALHHRTMPTPFTPVWREPGCSPEDGFHRQVTPDTDELYVPYVDDGSGWDEEW